MKHSMAIAVLWLGIGGCFTSEEEPPARVESLIEALLRGVRFENGEMREGDIPDADASADTVRLATPEPTLQLVPGEASIMSLEATTEESNGAVATLLQFEGADSHSSVPVENVGDGIALQIAQGIENPFTVSDDICAYLCNRRYTTRLWFAVELGDGAISPQQSVEISLDCREKGNLDACAGDAGAEAPDAGAGVVRDAAAPRDDGGPEQTDAGSNDAATTDSIVRTLVYHQVTDGTASITDVGVISADGSRIAFPIAHGTGDPATPNRIYAVNADGTGLAEVDSYQSLCFCESKVAISRNGSTIASTDSVQIRVVTSGGSLVGSLVLNSNEIWDIALANDGADVFFLLRRDAALAMGSTPIERGVWRMAADGTGLQQLAGPDAVATLLGVTPADVFPVSGCGPSLGVSEDGSSVVFVTGVAALGDVILGLDGDGTGLHTVIGPIGASQTAGPGVRHTTISSDGSTVVYEVGNMPGLVDPTEIGVVGFDGTGKTPITTSPPTTVGSCFTPFRLSADGGSLLLGDTGVLFPTAGGDPLSLVLRGGYFSTDPMQLVIEGNALSMTMSDDASRFVYLIGDTSGIVQAVTLDIDPASRSEAPDVSSPKITPASIPRDRSPAVLSARVAAMGTALRVGSAVLLDGLEDLAGSFVAGANVLTDDGMNGDQAAGDDVYTTNGITAGEGATVGPRTVRIKAEVTAGDGKRHATAVDIESFAIE